MSMICWFVERVKRKLRIWKELSEKFKMKGIDVKEYIGVGVSHQLKYEYMLWVLK